MNTVEAVKDRTTVELISRKLGKEYGTHYAEIWELGLQLALRISDLLAIRFSDIQHDRVVLREKKTGKIANILLNNKAKTVIAGIQQRYPDAEYLFQTRSRNVKVVKPLSRVSVARTFKSVGDDLCIALGTHSMRKTRGYMVYQATKDIGIVMKMLRHSTEANTLRYIGITQESVDEISMIEV